MEFRKCPRCGNFFHSEADVCQNCKTNENLDVQKLRTYFEENEGVTASSITVQDLSVQTGINAKNLNRYLVQDEFSEFLKQDQQDD